MRSLRVFATVAQSNEVWWKDSARASARVSVEVLAIFRVQGFWNRLEGVVRVLQKLCSVFVRHFDEVVWKTLNPKPYKTEQHRHHWGCWQRVSGDKARHGWEPQQLKIPVADGPTSWRNLGQHHEHQLDIVMHCRKPTSQTSRSCRPA